MAAATRAEPQPHGQVCLEYLERYYVLIAVASYLLEPSFDVADPARLPFSRWLAQRPELHRWADFPGRQGPGLLQRMRTALAQPEVLPSNDASRSRHLEPSFAAADPARLPSSRWLAQSQQLHRQAQYSSGVCSTGALCQLHARFS